MGKMFKRKALSDKFLHRKLISRTVIYSGSTKYLQHQHFHTPKNKVPTPQHVYTVKYEILLCQNFFTAKYKLSKFPSFLHGKKLSIEHAVPTFYYAKYKVPTIPSVLQCIMQYLQFQQC